MVGPAPKPGHRNSVPYTSAIIAGEDRGVGLL